VVQLGWEFSLVIYPGSTPVGNATLVVANVLTCNKYSQIAIWYMLGAYGIHTVSVSHTLTCACPCLAHHC
jgi:hypothetical protein